MTTRIKKSTVLLLVLLIASFLRFFNLMHDTPYFFNPDERNMAIAISQFRLPNNFSAIPNCLANQLLTFNLKPNTGLPAGKAGNLEPSICNLNPHFFAYGQFPLYLSFVSDQISSVMPNLFWHPNGIPDQVRNDALSTSHPLAIFWLRFWSALSSTLTVLIVYLITKQLLNNRDRNSPITNYYLPITTALLTSFSPGLIQSAHFGTTESLLTFFFLASVYLSLKLSSDLSNIFQNSKFEYRNPKQNSGYKLQFLKLFGILNINNLNLFRISCLGFRILMLSAVIGLAFGTKFTGIIFLAPPLLSLILQIIRVIKGRKKNKVRALFLSSFMALLLISGSIVFSIIFSPFNIIDLQGFKGSVFGYEADVATGKYEAFYTRQFVNTVPVLFQMEKIFPFALGWPTYILGFGGLIILLAKLFNNFFLFFIRRIMNYVLGIKKRKKDFQYDIHDSCFIILASFFIYFLPNAFLFTKWTRFMTPVFPFFSIFAGYFLFHIYSFITTSYPKSQKSKIKSQIHNLKLKNYLSNNNILSVLIFALCALSLLPGTAFMSIYVREDVRVTASRWIWQNIPDKSYILFETANVIDIPLGIPNEKLPQKDYPTVSFDYYHVDDNKELFNQLISHLEKANYLFIPSRRIFANFLRLPERYPLITKYYQLLYSGALGFDKVAEFSSYPSITFPLYPKPFTLMFPDESAEESFTVFDHPVIRIYQKTKSLSRNKYLELFQM